MPPPLPWLKRPLSPLPHPRPPSEFEKNICSSEFLLFVLKWLSSTNNYIDWRSENEGGFSPSKVVLRGCPNILEPSQLHRLYVDVVMRVTNTLYLDGVIKHRHVLLPNVVQLLRAVVFAEKIFLKFSHTSLGILASWMWLSMWSWTCCQTIHYPNCFLLPHWVVGIYYVGFIFEGSVDIAPISLAN